MIVRLGGPAWKRRLVNKLNETPVESGLELQTARVARLDASDQTAIINSTNTNGQRMITIVVRRVKYTICIAAFLRKGQQWFHFVAV